MRRIVIIAFLIFAAAPAGAQIMNVPKGSLATDPAFVVSTAVGLQAIQSVFDGRTQTIWNFSQAAEFGASLERSLGRGVSFGVGGSYAKVPLRYIDAATNNSSDAHVDVVTAGATFTAGGGVGFHQLVMISAGVIALQNFDVKTSALVSAPPTRDIDPRLAVGYGFAYGFSPRSEAFIIQEYGVALHQSDGLQGGDRRQYQQQTTRIGYRLGIGSR